MGNDRTGVRGCTIGRSIRRRRVFTEGPFSSCRNLVGASRKNRTASANTIRPIDIPNHTGLRKRRRVACGGVPISSNTDHIYDEMCVSWVTWIYEKQMEAASEHLVLPSLVGKTSKAGGRVVLASLTWLRVTERQRSFSVCPAKHFWLQANLRQAGFAENKGTYLTRQGSRYRTYVPH